MSERTEYEPGVPSWVDHSSPDPAGAARFYAGLFGWETVDRVPEDSDGEYHMASLRGKHVTALGPQPIDGAPPVWNTYVTVADADAAAKTVAEAGGTVLSQPFDVFDAGRMAVFTDPAGAVFMVWQPKETIGAELVNEPGTLSWNELITPDVDGSRSFYAAVFGWQTSTMEFAAREYTIWHPAGVEPGEGTGIGGMMSNESMPDGMPPIWWVYFAVEDSDATAAKAEELGGSVIAPAFDAPGVGRIALLTDPSGAAFSVITPERP